ncbi:MAG: selenocysteine-specific translation elongation factor [Candidatus Dormibacteria bacterium]
MPIIGTAGHVDHGKSTLVMALTGTDPDRLAEEKRRGMTIDLGFAALDLPRAGRTGIVDVPGHARFLHNMLAGVHGMDAVLLVVAADEGVMPQTREHLDILQLIGVRSVVVALTKVDLVDGELLELAAADVSAELERRSINTSVFPVSAPAGRGLGPLVDALDAALAGVSAADHGLGRLPIDRSFTIAGFGTVVTGTLVDGRLSVGQQLELLPQPDGAARRVRVRGLQQHGQAVTEALPGSRVAANLQGIDHLSISRGQVLAVPGTLAETLRLDARFTLLGDAPGPRHNSRVRVHAGTAEVAGRLVVLDREWVQLRLAAPLALRDGDRFILRRLSPSETLGGGEVVDRAAPLHRRGDAGVVAALAERGSTGGRVHQEIRRAHAGIGIDELARRLSLDPSAVEASLAQLVEAGAVRQVGTSAWDAVVWERLVRRAGLELEAQRRRNPLRPWMAAEELRERLGLDSRSGAEVLEAFTRGGIVQRREGGAISLPGVVAAMSAQQERLAERILNRLGISPLAPPRASELGEDPAQVADICQVLQEKGQLVRIAPDIWLLTSAVDAAVELLTAHLQNGRSVSVAEARDVLGSSRKVVVPLLEHLDRLRVTVRTGDVRRLRTGRGQ